MADAEMGLLHHESAIQRLSELHANFPDNYAVLVNYGQSLIDAGKPELAASVLLKGSRQFPKDLTVCEQLARAQASSHRNDYAYFTEAQCQLLQGRKKEALRQLKIAQSFVKSDRFMKARISAKIDEITYLMTE